MPKPAVRKRFIENNQCANCGRPHISPPLECSICRNKSKEYKKTKQAKWKSEGKCIQCGRTLHGDTNSEYCYYCRSIVSMRKTKTWS